MKRVLKQCVFRIVIVWMLVMGLLACGGGGGGGESTGDDEPADQAPLSVFDATTLTGSAPLLVSFDASTSTDADGTIIGYSWDFGDGSLGSGDTITHSFQSVGVYTVTLTVTDDTGLTGSSSLVITATELFSISGRVSAPTNTAVDSDLNDPNASFADNSSFLNAQTIPSPVTLGGYVNRALAGPRGRSFRDGDENDFYRISLTAGMQVGLYIANHDFNADLDLYLYDEAQELVDASVGNLAVETLEAPATGDFFIRVQAYTRASNYTLTIGQAVIAAGNDRLRLSDDFIPGEVMARFHVMETLNRDRATLVSAQAAAVGLQAMAGVAGQEILMSLKDAAQQEMAFSVLGIARSDDTSPSMPIPDPEIRLKLDTLRVIKAVQQRSDIWGATPNYLRRPAMVPDDEFYPIQWHYPQINLPQAWELTTGSSDVVVAVVDTGVLLAHQDLQGQLVAGYDFISSPSIAVDGDGMDPDPDDPGDQDPGGSSFHGTHVAGTIAAATGNGIGVAGVAGNTRIMPLRALGKGGGSSFDVLAAVRYAAGIENASGMLPERAADIINLSLGGGGASSLEQSVYQQVRDAGVIVVAAAGNERSRAPSYPAAYETVVSVSAVAIDDTLAPYSNFGSSVDVAAPGGDTSRDVNGDGYSDGILSTAGDDSTGNIRLVYSFYQGTSMATPHMAGVVALMKALYPGLTPAGLDTLLANGSITRDLGPVGRDDQFGHGLIDALAAVQEARTLAGGNGELPPTLVINPASLNFGSALDTLDVSVQNSGDGSLVVTQVTDGVDWLTITPPDTADGLGTYRIQVDRTGLAEGAYAATLRFSSTANSVSVPVVMQEIAFVVAGDTGFHYILLLDPETLDTLEQVAVAGASGGYPFSFHNIEYGTYLVFAGSDPNNDGIICDAGEACGAFIALDQPTAIDLTTDLVNINFGTEYNIDLPTQMAGFSVAPVRPLRRLRLKQVNP